MRIPFESRGRYNTLLDLKEMIENFDGQGNDEIQRKLLSWYSLIEDVLNKQHLGYATIFESSGKWETALSDYKSEIVFAINAEMQSLDPGSKHRLMSKSLAEMTGYEYQRFLKIISEQHD